VVAAALFAVAPAVQAYCGVELPAGALAPSQAGDQPSFVAETGDAGHSDVPCCGDSPDAVDDRVSPEHNAPLVGKAPVASLALAHGKTAAIFAAALHRARYDLPPPEPMFRRSPRLLL
jgi:hypothetical protein